MYSSGFSAFVIDILYTVKDQSSFYEIRSQAICINWVNGKQLNTLRTFVKYLKNILLLTEDDSALKVA